MPCHAPPQHAHLKWHVIKRVESDATIYERAQWVPDNGAGYPIWIRWGYCGDFASLCQSSYVGPAVDQDSPYVRPEDGGIVWHDDARRL